MSATPVPLSLDVYSDVVCPWCYVGLRKLRAAEAMVADEVALAIRWHPFQLDPTIPPEGVGHDAYLTRKFGSAAAYKAGRDRVAEEGRKAGIAFAFDRISISPNTLKAHALVDWAERQGVAPGLVEALFAAYFEQGRDLSDDAVLAEIAEEQGADGDAAYAQIMASPNAADISTRIAAASRMGVNSVPCFVIEGRYAVLGAQPPETLADAFRQVARAKAEGVLPAAQ
ncbi:MAG: DsbA family oxidoreductase [Rhizobiaceae bacterium]|nr:DsbA family oxidoreductase [Rhizobiaceae bacterium]